jgi:hypothetical protein
VSDAVEDDKSVVPEKTLMVTVYVPGHVKKGIRKEKPAESACPASNLKGTENLRGLVHGVVSSYLTV